MTTNGTQRGSQIVATLSLLVAILSLGISLAVVYNGSSRQATFESNRQLCIDGLAGYSRTILEIRYSDAPLSPAQTADYVVDGARAKLGCFDTHLLDGSGTFAQEWRSAEVRTQQALSMLPASADADFADSEMGQLVSDVSKSFLDQQFDAINAAMDAAVEAPGLGFLPWESPVQPTPTFPSMSIEPTPAA